MITVLQIDYKVNLIEYKNIYIVMHESHSFIPEKGVIFS